jgi:hypothetical protein
MVGKGVVDAVMATLAAVQGEGDQALPVQQSACTTLQGLSRAADNRVRLRGWGPPCCEGCVVRVVGIHVFRGLSFGVAFPSELACVPRHVHCCNRSAEGELRLQRVFVVCSSLSI